jgi:hypothetical protein
MFAESVKTNFEDILRQAMSGKKSFRPPKIEVLGRIIQMNDFILELESEDYRLVMSKNLQQAAARLNGSEVIVKGVLTSEENVIDVERIIPITKIRDAMFAKFYNEPYDEVELLRHAIMHEGKIQPALEEIA